MISIAPIYDLTEKSLIEFCSESVIEDSISRLGIKFSLDGITRALMSYSSDADKACFIARNHTKIAGVVLGTETNYPFTNEKICSQYFLRVSKDCRGAGIGAMLSERLMKWAKDRGCMLMTCGVHETVTAEQDKARASIEKMGFKEFSRQYYREI